MRTILLIATGGTIASRPTAAGGLAPAITSQELLSCVPELAEFCRIDAIQLYNLDSTNMGPEQWQGIAAAVQENYDRYDAQLHDPEKPQTGGADRQPEIDL